MSKIQARQHHLKDGKLIIIRSAEKSDAMNILALGKSVMTESIYTLTEPDELNLTVEQEADWIQSHLDHLAKLIVVAENDGQIIGILDFSNGHRRRIAHQGDFGMSVEKSWREQGIGAVLLSALLEWAKESAVIEKVNLKVHATNDRAISLYKKFGFIEEGRQKRDLKLGPNQYVDTILMGRFVK